MTVVMTSGVFDILHPGHFYHLRTCRQMGDLLVVAVTTDRFVNKGPGRPVHCTQDRMAMLSQLRCVTLVLMSDEQVPIDVIKVIRPDLYVKHEEYRDKLPEQKLVESLGGEVVFTDWKIHHSSKIAPVLVGMAPHGPR